jgi:hypothetical protein
MRDVSGLWLALLVLAFGTVAAVAGGAAAVPEQDDELLALLDFLGDEETASEEWNGFFDSLPERLPERPGETIPRAPDPVAAEEVEP